MLTKIGGLYGKEPTIEELKNFLGEYLELKGVNTSSVFRCFSPEHEDKHPSMSFYKKGNICNCFACGQKYNIFSLVGMEYGFKGFKEQKEKVIKTLRYPLVLTIALITLIMVFNLLVIPQFENIYTSSSIKMYIQTIILIKMIYLTPKIISIIVILSIIVLVYMI